LAKNPELQTADADVMREAFETGDLDNRQILFTVHASVTLFRVKDARRGEASSVVIHKEPGQRNTYRARVTLVSVGGKEAVRWLTIPSRYGRIGKALPALAGDITGSRNKSSVVIKYENNQRK